MSKYFYDEESDIRLNQPNVGSKSLSLVLGKLGFGLNVTRRVFVETAVLATQYTFPKFIFCQLRQAFALLRGHILTAEETIEGEGKFFFAFYRLLHSFDMPSQKFECLTD